MKRILIVDDNEPNLYLLRSLLCGYGYTVEEARNGAVALSVAHQNPPDLIISDLFMPVLDGYSLLRLWKAEDRLKDIPFVVYTATYTDPKDERLALDLGADMFIIKPAEPVPFMARILEVLAKAESGNLSKPNRPTTDNASLLEAQTEVLIRKLERKAMQLERTNSELIEEIAERKRTEGKLRESEERFRELAETIQEVFWITDPLTGTLIYISPAYEKIWGRTCDSLHGSPRDWTEAIHPEDRERIRLSLEGIKTGGVYDETFRISRPDGEVRWIRDRGFPVRNARGEAVRIVGTAEDITEQRRLEAQFRQAQKLEAIGQLAAGVAHDFNNILAVILGNSEMALTLAAKGRPVENCLEEIRKAGGRAKDLVKQVLTFSRQQPQVRHVIDLGPTIQETVSFLNAIIPSAIELAVTVDPSAPAVLADPTQLHQVITNLCTNAWHAFEGRPGQIKVKLEPVTLDAAEAARLGGIKPGIAACVSVSDTGKGMDAAMLERIFDPFYTTKEPGKGTGLGLAVVQGVVEGHDGAISVHSRPGEGTTFKVYFPAAEAAGPESRPDSAPVQGEGQHILYLDDEAPILEITRQMFEKLGYRFTGFTRPEDALVAFHADPDSFDLVVTDMKMMGASGLSVAADLLRLRPELPIVLCSGHVTEALRQRARKVGIGEVLYKPCTMAEFSVALHHLLSKKLAS